MKMEKEKVFEIGSNDHANNFFQKCANLLSKNQLVDCTIVCSDGQLQSHKVILAASCKYMHELLTTTVLPTPCSHPMIFMRSWKVEDLQIILTYMYTGKASIPWRKVATILKMCEELEYKRMRTAMKVIPKSTMPELNVLPNGTRASATSSPTINGKLHENCSPGEAEHDAKSNNQTDLGDDCSNSKSNLASSRSSIDSNSNLKTNIAKNFEGSFQENEQDHLEDLHANYGTVQHIKSSNGQSAFNGIRPSKNKRHIMEMDNLEGLVNFAGAAKRIMLSPRRAGENDFGTLPIKLEDEYESDDDENEDADSEELIGIVNPGDLLEASQDFREDDNDNEETQSGCPWCNETFTNVALLQKHLKTHVNKYRPYSCEYCQNSFARSAHLKRHLRVHTGEKPYVCPIPACQRAFARQDKLKGHMERHFQQANRTAESLLSPPPTANDAMTITSFSQVKSNQTPVKVQNGGKPVGRGKSTSKPSLDSLLLGNSSNGNRFEIGSTTSNGLSISLASSNTSENREKSTSSNGLTVTPAPRPSSSYIQSLISRGAGTTMFTTGDDSLIIKRESKHSNKPTNYMVNYNG